MEQICIRILNPSKLKKGLRPYCIVTNFGGIIGSDKECFWNIQDEEESIMPEHVRISYEEDCFGISSVNGAPIFLNKSFSPLMSSYDFAVNVGDSFSIGSLELCVASPEEARDLVENASVALENINRYEKLDNVQLKLSGTVENFDAEDSQIIEKLVDNSDILGIAPTMEGDFKEDSISSAQNKSVPVSKSEIMKLISKIAEDMQKDYSLKESTLFKASEPSKLLTMKDIEYMVKNTHLIKSATLVNAAVLTMILNELDSPIFEEMGDNYFLKTILSGLSRSLGNDAENIERLCLRAIIKYAQER